MVARVVPVEVDLARQQLVAVQPLDVVAHEQRRLVAVLDLRKAGDAGPDARDGRELRGIGRDVRRVLGARADERHVAAQHVQELRDLVQLGAGEEPADTSEAGIIDDRERRPGRVSPHLAELVHLELAAAMSDAARPVEHWSRLVEQDGKRDHQPERTGHDDQEAGDGDVECPRQEWQRAVEQELGERAEGRRQEHGEQGRQRREAPSVDAPAHSECDHHAGSCRQRQPAPARPGRAVPSRPGTRRAHGVQQSGQHCRSQTEQERTPETPVGDLRRNGRDRDRKREHRERVDRDNPELQEITAFCTHNRHDGIWVACGRLTR